MKYIRTKNGIYEVKTKRVFNHIKEYRLGDTIEELCDEFVVVNNTCFNTPQLLGTIIDKDYYKHEEVYAAIWTDKGLIYVAKMNNEGCLQLI